MTMMQIRLNTQHHQRHRTEEKLHTSSWLWEMEIHTNTHSRTSIAHWNRNSFIQFNVRSKNLFMIIFRAKWIFKTIKFARRILCSDTHRVCRCHVHACMWKIPVYEIHISLFIIRQHFEQIVCYVNATTYVRCPYVGCAFVIKSKMMVAVKRN